MIDFIGHKEIAMTKEEFQEGLHKALYRYNYAGIFTKIANEEWPARETYRELILNDLWFIVYFVLNIPTANHPFVVKMCQVVQDGPRSHTLDIWARGHYKSSIITIAETLQEILKNPEVCHAILAYNRPAAKKFLRIIKRTCEESELLKWCFPEIVWANPSSQAPKWSEDDGLVFNRKSSSRGEATVEAWGLTEGMPTGRHYERVVFDDLETDDIKDSPDQLNKVYDRFEMAENLGTQKGSDVTRVIGTYYSHFGPNVKIGEKKLLDGRPMFNLRIVPGSDNGLANGNPVYVDSEVWERLKMSSTFNSQQLCNPTPVTDISLNFDYLRPVEPEFIPKDIYKFMVIDQAGDDPTNKQRGDLWSYGVVAIKPKIDDIGASDVYILDVEADRMSHSEGISNIVNMFIRNGMVLQIGVEKVGLSTTELHITNALKARGRMMSAERGTIVLLSPAQRSKEFRVVSALQWPLNNGKLFYSTRIHPRYIDAIREEMRKFPFFHVDILDMIAYAYDLFKGYRFQRDQTDFKRFERFRQADVSEVLM